MSSTVSNSEVQTIPKNECYFDKKNSNKQQQQQQQQRFHRLVRTTSLEKIRRFNTFICSQQYYILPSILLWLKTSQNSLQITIEKTIHLFRSIIFLTIYKLYQIDFKTNFKSIRIQFNRFYSNFLKIEQNNLLKLLIYIICLSLILQIVFCLYLFLSKGVTLGLLFLIFTWFYINYLHYKTVYFYQKYQQLDYRRL